MSKALSRRLQLLSAENAKLRKAEKHRWLTVGLSLLPHKAGRDGVNLCPSASRGCARACLNLTGNGFYPVVQEARRRRRELFVQDRRAFMLLLYDDLATAQAYAAYHKLKLACRLNVFSDLLWEHIDPSLFSRFPDVQFYDYTKIPGRRTPPNYHLTFSRSETNEAQALKELEQGRNVTVVFDRVPRKWQGYWVTNGDLHDMRWIDKPKRVIGLKAKGMAQTDTTGFVVRG